MKLLRIVSTPLIVPLACALAFLSLASGPAQAGGPNVQVQTNGTLDGVWVCGTSVGDEIQFPFVPEECLFYERIEDKLVRFSAHVSGSWDELTGRSTSQSVGPHVDPVENDFANYEWVGSVEADLLVLDGIITRDKQGFVGTPVQLWVELDTGATQVDYKLPLPGVTVHVILLGFSGVSTNQ